MTQKTVNIQFLDILRALSTVGVILIHISTPVLKMTFGQNMNYWWIGNGMDSAVRFVIAMFLMLTGATMLHKSYRLTEFYRKRLFRVILPFLFWSAIYCVFIWLKLPHKTQPSDFQSIIPWAIHLFVNENISRHLWYVYMIIQIYLIVPFIAKFVQKLSISWLWVILTSWLLVNTALSFHFFQLPSGNLILQKYINYGLYLGFLLLGFALMKIPVPSFKVRIISGFTFMTTVFVAAITTYYLSIKAHKLDTSCYGTLTANTIIQAVSLFIILKDIILKSVILTRITNLISNYSFGIYLVHILVVNQLFDHKIYWKIAYPLISLPALLVLVLLLSMGIVYVLRKIPGGKYIAG